MVLDLYTKRKEAKEFLDYFVDPDEKELVKTNQQKIANIGKKFNPDLVKKNECITFA